MRVKSQLWEVNIIREEKQKQNAFGLKFALANRRRRREESKSKRKRRKKRKKKEEKRFKNQVCLCLRIKCMGFLGLRYGD